LWRAQILSGPVPCLKGLKGIIIALRSCTLSVTADTLVPSFRDGLAEEDYQYT